MTEMWGRPDAVRLAFERALQPQSNQLRFFVLLFQSLPFGIDLAQPLLAA